MKDEKVAEILNNEVLRQTEGLELIPSENYVSKDVLTALGSVLTNKYAEGYPGRRYYGGQQNTDAIERLAIERAKQLFGADHANVQPHSGAAANEAVYSAWLKPGDTVLAMDLSHGGHLTHGAAVTRSAQLYRFVRYKMKDPMTGEIDYDELRHIAHAEQPKIILAGFSAYPRQLDYARFAEIGREVGALLMADVAHIAGLIAGGVADNPFKYGFHVMTSTTHKTLRGPRGGLILSKGVVGNPLVKPPVALEHIPTLIDRAVFPGMQGGPHMHTIAAKAVAFGEALRPEFADYARAVVANAQVLAQELLRRGFTLIGGGTDNHLLLIDMVASRDVDGKTAERALDAVGLTVNANSVPDDPRPQFAPSGIRLGTPAITTRGMQPKDMAMVAGWIDTAITVRDDTEAQRQLAQEVQAVARQLKAIA